MPGGGQLGYHITGEPPGGQLEQLGMGAPLGGQPWQLGLEAPHMLNIGNLVNLWKEPWWLFSTT